MNQELKNYINTVSPVINLTDFIISILLTIILSVLLSLFYVKYANSSSNRKIFARNFLILSLTTMLVISIVKSSLALSLGLVGALSIVRFRAAIKEPEELTYLFLSIAIGLGFGANQKIITTIAFIIILIAIYFQKYFSNKNINQDGLYFNIRTAKLNLIGITKILQNHCSSIKLKRIDEHNSLLEATFIILSNNIDKIENIKKDINSKDLNAEISFINNENLF